MISHFKEHEFLNKPNHHTVCSLHTCNPENESALRHRGLIPKDYPLITNDRIYVCNYGVVHECDELTCMNNTVCPISGLSDGFIPTYSSYDKHDSRTWEKNIKYKRKNITDDEVYEKAEFLVDTMLYSKEHRTKINEKWKKQQLNACKNEKNTSLKPNLPINLIQLAMIHSKYDGKTLPLELLDYDQQKITYYVNLIAQIYKKVQLYNPGEKICIESITLGLLYKMKQGIKMDDITVIPVDIFLVEHLPLMNDLPSCIDKRKFTKGEKWITMTIDKSRKAGDLFSLEEKHVDTLQVFMPTSRKKITTQTVSLYFFLLFPA
jgi:hypothetical protein